MVVLFPPPSILAQPSSTLPGEFLYPSSSQALWSQVKELGKDLELRDERVDDRHHIFVSRWIEYRPGRFVDDRALSLSPGSHPRAVQFHVFVPPEFDPARIAVGAILEARTAENAVVWIYGHPGLASWFVTRLTERVRTVPEALAENSSARAAQSQRMKPGAFKPDCSPAVIATNKPIPPRRLSDFIPEYPGDTWRPGNVTVAVQGLVTEHGTYTNLQTATQEPSNMTFVSAAKAAAGLWRFEPARVGGCRTAVFLTTTVSFNTR